jgi:hypothetical protein
LSCARRRARISSFCPNGLVLCLLRLLSLILSHFSLTLRLIQLVLSLLHLALSIFGGFTGCLGLSHRLLLLSPKRSLLLFSLSASGFCLGTPASILIGLVLSFFRVSLSGLSIGLSLRLSLGCRPACCLFPLLLFLAKRQHAGVFRHLRGSTRRGADWCSSLFPLLVVLGTLQHVFRFHEAAV